MFGERLQLFGTFYFNRFFRAATLSIVSFFCVCVRNHQIAATYGSDQVGLLNIGLASFGTVRGSGCIGGEGGGHSFKTMPDSSDLSFILYSQLKCFEYFKISSSWHSVFDSYL